MGLYKNNDVANNTSQEFVAGFGKKGNTANRAAFYGNTTVDAFVKGQKVGVFAVTAGQMGKKKNLKVGSVTVGSNGGANYTNGDIVTVAGAVMTVNASFTVTTNTTGGVASLAVANAGVFTSGPNTTPNATTTNRTVVNASANGLLVNIKSAPAFEGDRVAHPGWNIRREGTGGRAGRVQYETLVAGGISGASNNLSSGLLG